MISFRFHLVSVVAVFLALGLGVLAGTTVLNRGIVAQLERQTDRLVADADGLREDVQRLQADNEEWTAFGDLVMRPLVAGRLAGREVIVVTQEGADEESISGVRRTLDDSGAELRALLAVSPRMDLESDADRREVAGVVGESPSDPAALREEVASALAGRLGLGPGPRPDVLEELLRAGLLVNQGAGLEEADLRSIGGPGQAIVVVGGGTAAAQPEPAAFLVPLVDSLAANGSRVLAAEPATAADPPPPPFVTLLRSDGDVAGLIASQDNVDQVPGQVGLVLALQDLLEGSPGHYGVKDGASGPLPELT